MSDATTTAVSLTNWLRWINGDGQPKVLMTGIDADPVVIASDGTITDSDGNSYLIHCLPSGELTALRYLVGARDAESTLDAAVRFFQNVIREHNDLREKTMSDIAEYAGFDAEILEWWADKPHQVVRDLWLRVHDSETKLTDIGAALQRATSTDDITEHEAVMRIRAILARWVQR